MAGAGETESLEICVLNVHAFGNVCAGFVIAGRVVRVRVQYPGEVQRHVYAHGVVERGFCFQRERLHARVGCATAEMEADHILERGLWSSSGLVVQDNSAKYVSGPVRVLNVSAFGNVCAPGA